MSDPVEKLYHAAYFDDASETSFLLRNYPDINVNWTDNEGWAPLHMASFNGHIEVVKRLLAHADINVNLKSDDGQTPPFLLVV